MPPHLLRFAGFRRLGLEIALALSWVGCVAPHPTASGGAFVPQPIELPAQPPSQDPTGVDPSAMVFVGEEEPITLGAAATADAGPPVLPVSWSVTFGHTRPFSEAMALASDARRTFERVSSTIVSSGDGGAPTPKQFERASSLLDQGSRLYAAAYHAPNASLVNRIDTLRDAADMILAWSRRLDEAGLARAPAAYRSDPSVALTFEDVANGPAKRWREEGVALLHLCLELARTGGVDSPSARECMTMRRTYSRVIVASQRRSGAMPFQLDGGSASTTTATGCACDPGDPLCSASMSGWCRPTK